jgi:hypothetical protein
MALVRQRKMLSIEMAEDYTGYTALMIRNAVRRGELKGERPGKSPRSRLYFDREELDRWIESAQESA